MLGAMRQRLEALARIEAAPRRTAAALAVGVGLSFSPLFGLQILIGIGAAVAFRLSRVAVLVGLCANVPWVMVPWYAGTTAVAAILLGTSSGVDLSEQFRQILSVPFYRAAFWGHTVDLLETYFWPFLIGPSLGALALGAITYAVALRVLTDRAVRHADRVTLQPDADCADHATRQRDADSVLPGGAEKRAADGHVDDA